MSTPEVLLEKQLENLWLKVNHRRSQSTDVIFKNLAIEVVDTTTIPLLETVLLLPNVLLAFVKNEDVKQDKISCSSIESVYNNNFNDSEENVTKEFFGSPLECPFSLHNLEKKLDESVIDLQTTETFTNNLLPLRTNEAHLLVNLYSMELIRAFSNISADKEMIIPPLIALCDEGDGNCTCLVGVGRYSKTESFSIIGTCSFGSISRGLPKLDQIVHEHKQISSKSAALTQEIVSTFNMLDSDSGSKLTLKFQWNLAKEILQTPPVNASCQVELMVVPGEIGSPLCSLYSELSILTKAAECLKSSEMTWSMTEDEESALNKVTEIVDSLKEGMTYRQVDLMQRNMENIDFSACLEDLILGKKNTSDFTSQLWSALIGCQSYKELNDCFVLVCESVSKGLIRPIVSRNNTTSLGKWIRKIAQGEIENFPLDNVVSTMKIFLEIGIEKLKNHYCDIFVGLELTTQDLLKKYLVETGDFSLAVSCLNKLHLALEVVVLCKTQLYLPQLHLGTLARKALKSLELLNIETDCSELIFPLPTSSVKPITNGLNPQKWQISLKTEDGNFSNFTVVSLLIDDGSPNSPSADAKHSHDSKPNYKATTLVSVHHNM